MTSKRILLVVLVLTLSISAYGQPIYSSEHSGEVVRNQLNLWIDEFIATGAQMRVIVMAPIDGINIVGFANSDEDKRIVADERITDYVRMTLRARKPEQVTIVSRSLLETALAELELQVSGLVAQDQMLRVGEFLGATHILLLSESRVRSGERYTMREKYELIDIQTSAVVALSTFRMKLELELRLGQQVWDILQAFVDGREVVMDDDVLYWRDTE